VTHATRYCSAVPVSLRSSSLLCFTLPVTSALSTLSLHDALPIFNHPLNKAQISGQKLLRFIHNKNALHIKLEAMCHIPLPQIKRRFFWHIEQGSIIEAAFHRLCDHAKAWPKS